MGDWSKAVWEQHDLQRMWLYIQELEWRSLALVPAGAHLSVVPLARGISALGLQHRREPIGVADLRNVALENVSGHADVVRWHVNRGERVIIALGPPGDDGMTIPVAGIADCAILCVELGSTRIADAQRLVSELGRDLFIGTVIMRPAVGLDVTGAPAQNRRLGA